MEVYNESFQKVFERKYEKVWDGQVLPKLKELCINSGYLITVDYHR